MKINIENVRSTVQIYSELDYFDQKDIANLCDLCVELIDKLAEYENEDEQGLLLHLPCSIGSDVHVVAYCNETCSLYLTGVDGCCADCHREGAHRYSVVRKDFLLNDIDRFGNTIFLTREEAESKLRGMSND